MNDTKDITIVTGASRGIGKAIAIKFAEEGHNLALFGRDTEKLKETAAEVEKHGAAARIFSGDAGNEKFVSDSVNKIYDEFGKVDHLINNAGAAVFKKFTEVNLDEFKKQVEVNMYGIFNFTKAVIDKMIERKSGSIINIASLAGKNGFAGGTTYTATKHAVMGFSKSLMLEVREYNIRVAVICPGSVATEMLIGTSMNPSNVEKILAPQDIADVVYSVINMPLRALVSEIDVRPLNPRG